MFRTGSGKSVLISENSVQKARAVLEEQGINKGIIADQTYLRLSLFISIEVGIKLYRACLVEVSILFL